MKKINRSVLCFPHLKLGKQIVIIAALLLMTAAGTANAEIITGRCPKALTYSLDTETGTLTISGKGTMADFECYDDSRAPWYDYRQTIKHIVVDSGVTNIGNCAFKHDRRSFPLSPIPSPLESVTLPRGLQHIGDKAFNSCNTLESITLPEGLTSIGNEAFAYCSAFTSITIPEGVTRIGNDSYASVFGNCTALESVTLPKGIKEIGANVFEDCTSLSSIVLPEGLEKIGFSAFNNCTSLSSIVLPEGLKKIESYAFFGCALLQSITMHEGLSIEDEAFHDCASLASVYDYAFEPQELNSVFTSNGDNYSDTKTPLKNVDLFVPPSSVQKYFQASGEWEKFGNIQPIADWVPVTGVKLDRNTVPLAPGGKTTIKVTVTPDNASNKFLRWSSSNGNAAGFVNYDQSFIVSKISGAPDTIGIHAASYGKGTSVITVTTEDGGFRASCKVVVIPAKSKAVKGGGKKK